MTCMSCLIIGIVIALSITIFKRLFKTSTIAFFHPNCCDFGGGERVLWTIVKALLERQDKRSSITILACSSSCLSEKVLADRLKERFGIVLKLNDNQSIHVVRLRTAFLLDASLYKRCTLLCQAFASVLVMAEALLRARPSVIIDTSGYAFGLPLAKYIGGAKTSAYIHYPFISRDMVAKTALRKVAVSNTEKVARSLLLTTIKLVYYEVILFLYSCSLSSIDKIVTNSTWTQTHVKEILGVKHENKSTVIFPPCPVQRLVQAAHSSVKERASKIVSVAQFRPEKNQAIQIEAFDLLIDRVIKRQSELELPTLHICGAVRDDRDQIVLDKLRAIAQKSAFNSLIHFHVNASFEELLDLFLTSQIGLHTMEDEHFGIVLVEFMAVGLLPIAHNSAGPRHDILVGIGKSSKDTEFEKAQFGYLCDSSASSFASAMLEGLTNTPKREDITKRAQKQAVKIFGSSGFGETFLSTVL